MSRDALVVGINTYDRLKCLNAPAADAEAIAQILQQYGELRVTRLPAVKDKENETIRIGKQTKVSLTQLEKAIVQLFKPDGKPPDTALLYFSGHGLRKNQGIQEGFLATSEVNPDAGNWGLSLQWLRRLLQESEVRQQIVILDCCYSGEVLNFVEADPGDRGKGRDRCFIAASRDFEVAFEEINSQHSVLTAALLKGLEPKQDRWVSNYTLVDLLNQEHHPFPQRPIFANSGEAINLTRKWNSSPVYSTVQISAICPYKGLSYFDCTEADAKLFYGRTALTDELLEKVRSGNFLAVLGASGSGKSSVVRAGLLYQLKLGRRLSGSDTWQLKIFRPGINPLQNLALAFVESELSDIERASQLAKAEELIARGAVGLGQLITGRQTQRVVLVVDQFEEAFTLCQDIAKRQKFFECLLGALQRHDNKLCLVITMRVDFFDMRIKQEYGGLAKKIQDNLVTVTTMSREELTKAIFKPAKQVNLEVEPELILQMIVDVESSPVSLPLLQYTLTEIWKQRTEERLTLNAYTRLGGVRGTLQKRATEVYESLLPEEQQITKRIFLELTQLGEGTEDTRKQVLQRDFVTLQYPEVVINSVIQRLTDEKLIVSSSLLKKGSGLDQVAVIDVAHEALIRHWSLLRQWIEENRDILRQKRKIEAAAVEWRDRGKAEDDLFQGNRLRSAKDFHEQQAEDWKLSDLAIEFIQVSIKQKRNNRLKFVGFVLIIPLIMSVIVGIVVTKRILWHTVDTVKGNEYSREKIKALETLVRLGDSLANQDFSRNDLSRANLSSADLNGAILNSTILNGANLSDANLNGAKLNDANLSDANLSDANLNDAILYSAKLSKVNLTSANLSKANLSSADISSANLSKVNLTSANLSKADISSADISSANLSKVNLKGAIYTHETKFPENFDPTKQQMYLIAPDAKLRDADLSGANLILVNLSRADLSGANLRGANLSFWTNLSSANLSKADLRGVNLSAADLRGANLKGAIYTHETKFSEKFDPTKQQMYLIAPNADLRGADLRGADLSFFTNLSGANLSAANLSGVNLNFANLSSANLSKADLRGVNLSDADLRGANLKGAIYTHETKFSEKFDPTKQQMYLIAPNADLRGADLRGADLSGVNLRGANLSGADLSFFTNLSGANLSGANLSSANLSFFTNLSGANLSFADLRGVKNLIVEQIKSTKNWEQAKYDKDFRTKLGLPPEPLDFTFQPNLLFKLKQLKPAK
ncbi:pentapeptide repeat-containing protein [uncultured Nostoc sp.]|uniref:nSTAND1 domain-containing NTPase n=1 Tax=uncultured Nostoc sp. TaxID=340711 RepID=UPI0035CA58C5